MSIFRSAFEKLSVENQFAIAEATRITAQSVSPGGALFNKIEELIRAVAAQGKAKESKSGGSGDVGSSIMMKLFGGKAMTQIGKGLQEIVKALNSLKGDSTETKEKFEAIVLGIDALAQLGPSILKFAGYMALAAPLLLIGAITSPLFAISVYLITKALQFGAKPLADPNTRAALEGLKDVAWAILALGVALTLAVPLYAYGIRALPSVVFTLLLLGGTFYLLDKMGVDASMKKTADAIIFASLAILALGASLLLTSVILNQIDNPWETTFKILGMVLLTGLTFALVGLAASPIRKGVGVMILAAIPIILLGLSVALFSTFVPPTADGWETLGQIGAFVVGLGLAMAAAGAAAAFIIPGAAAMMLAGISMIFIAGGVAAMSAVFKTGKIDALLADSGHETEAFLGFGGGRMMSKLEYLFYAIANSFLLNPATIASMYATVPIMLLAGVALMSVAKGIESFQRLKINYDVLPLQISKVTTLLAGAFGAIGEKFPGGRNFLSFVGAGAQSAVANGIDAVLGMGSALTSIATGIQAMSNLRFPIYQGTKVVGYQTLDNGVFARATQNTKILTNLLADVFAEIGIKYPGGSSWFSGLGAGQSPVADGIDAVRGMGGAVGEIARGVQDMANLKFPIYQGTKIVGYTTLDASVWARLRTNIQNLVSGISGIFGKIGKSPDAEDPWGWFGKSNIERGISLVEDFSNPLTKLVNTAKVIASAAVDPAALSAKITGVISAFTSAYAAAGKNKTIDMEMVTMTGNLASNIKNIVQQASGFERFVDSYGRYVNHFIKFKDTVNQFDKENLKLTNDIFNGLTYLSKTDDAIEKMGDQLVSAIQKLSEMIQEAKTTITTNGEQQSGLMSGLNQMVGGLKEGVNNLIGGSAPAGTSSTPGKPTPPQTPGRPGAPAPAGQDMSALIASIEELISKFNDSTGSNAPFVRLAR